MAKLTVLPEQTIISGLKGKIDFYLWLGLPVARKWPRSPGHNRAPAVQAQWTAFTEAAQLWSQLDDEVRQAWQEMAIGTAMTARDLFTQAYISGNIEADEF